MNVLTRALGISSASQKLKFAVGMLQKNKIEFSLVFSVFLLGFIFYLWIFLRNQLLPLIDGPYYLIQVRSLLTTGGFVYGDPPLTFYLLSLFSLLLGDITLGVKVGVSFFCALSTIPTYFLMKRVSKSILASIIAMLLVIFSSLYIRMLTDFMKNAVGLCWLLAFIYYLHDLVFSGFKKSSLALATFFIILTGLTHILVFGVALLFLVLYAATVLIFNVNRRPFLKAVSIIVLAICTFVFIASTFFGFLFTDFNKIFSFIRALFTPQGSGSPSPIPYDLAPGPGPSSGVAMDGYWLFMIGAFFIIFLGAILSFYAWKKRKKEGLLLLTTSTIVGSIMSFPLIPGEWLGRFVLMLVVPNAIILSYGISKVWSHNKRNFKFIALVLIALCLLFFVGQSVMTATNIQPMISNEGYLDLVNMKGHIPSGSVVILIEFGLRYWVEYVDEVDITQARIEQWSDLWQSYSHVLSLFPRGGAPPFPYTYETIFVGNVFTLVELQQKNTTNLNEI